jgi:hypothetical protein
MWQCPILEWLMNLDEIDPEEVKKNLAQAVDHLDRCETDEAEKCLLRYCDTLQSMIDNLQRVFNLQVDHPPIQHPGTHQEEAKPEEE